MDLYFTDRELTKPYDSGLSYRELNLEEMRRLRPELTEKERESVFAEYYDLPLEEIPEEAKAAIKAGPLDEKYCFMPDQAGEILLSGNPGFPDFGYGVMSNGVGFASVMIHQDGITDEMIRLYREEFARDPERRNLFYKTWYPGKHYIHFTDAIIEDYGWGPVFQEMNWEAACLSHLGITKEMIAERRPDCIAFIILGGDSYDLSNPDVHRQAFMVQFTVETERGRDLRLLYWMGTKPGSDGSFTAVPEEDRQTTLSHMKDMMIHGITEYVNELGHMKRFWKITHKELADAVRAVDLKKLFSFKTGKKDSIGALSCGVRGREKD